MRMMKKKLIGIVTFILILLVGSVPAFAANNVKAPTVVKVSQKLTVGHVDTKVEETVPPDAEGELSFENLESRMMENYKGLKALSENIAALDAIDYDKMGQDMRDKLNDIADLQWLNMSLPSQYQDAYTTQSLQQAYDSLKEAYDDLKDGTTQKNHTDQKKYLKNMQNQIVMTAETLYIALQDMSRTNEQLGRQLESLDRTVQEMELRYTLGQISELTLQQVKAGRTSLVSGKETLEMNIKNYSMQMQMMVGVPLSGEIKLHDLPKVTDEQLAAMDLEKDLIAAKGASYELLAAKNTLDAAEDDYEEAKDDYKAGSYEMKSAQHAWQGAQYQYEAAIEKFEGNFRTLFLQVKDYKQVLEASKVALALQKSLYEVEKLKYDQGNLAYNKLLDAQDEVSAAENDVVSAEVNLFSAYNNYRWAVEHGLVN